MNRSSTNRSLIHWIAKILCLSCALAACDRPLHGQTATELHQVKKIYVDTFAYKLGATELRQRIIDDLRKDRTLEMVSAPSQADAVLKSSGEIWVKAYISVNPRSPGSRYPTYGGFLSSQLLGKGGETLWSDLVTGGTSASDIHQELAQKLVKNLQAALRDATPAAVAGQPAPGISSTIKAAGATFPAPLYQAWISSFHQHHPGIQIRYDSVGSEEGLRQLRDNKITIAASDVPLSVAQMAEMPRKVLQFATVIGAVVPIYNLHNVSSDLRFTPEILAGIYLGKIRRWNDPMIRSVNRSVSLPDAEIVVIHRADGSGTTFAFTEFLSRTDPAWRASVGSGTTVNWPAGQGVQGNDGVASTVDRTPNSIGYTELTFAIQRQLNYGMVRNASGNFVQANFVSLAASAAGVSSDSPATSLVNSPGKDSYPITSFTWLIVPETIPDAATKSAVAEFLDWILTSGQKECSALAYNPLPKEIAGRELQLLTSFKSK